jgi:hypothetical protein
MSEYAPEYSTKERVLFLIKHLLWAIPLVVSTKLWFLPWLKAYGEQSHCYDYGFMSGTEVLFYGFFVGIPMSMVLLIALIEGPRMLKVFRLEQNPLPGEKVFRPTKYQYGVRAKLKPYAVIVILILLVGFSIRSVFWAKDMIKMTESSELPVCQLQSER